MAMKDITIYTDGACSGNPGPGGWGGIILYENHRKEISGFEENTTNNVMELKAVIESLKALNKKCNVKLYTDSKYIVDSITKWVYNWQKNGWRTSKKEPVKNKELLEEILNLSEIHNIEWHWVKGHDGNQLNEDCDQLAKHQIIINAIN
ncbi:MAG: ribonuclease HI [Candidatus Delongbacteria bacterium]|nr:ribonuclease HI [Candidatus Delongbacteria bacterium]